MVYYRFTTDFYDWFGFVWCIILLNHGVLNNILPKLANIFEVFHHYLFGRSTDIQPIFNKF